MSKTSGGGRTVHRHKAKETTMLTWCFQVGTKAKWTVLALGNSLENLHMAMLQPSQHAWHKRTATPTSNNKRFTNKDA